MNKRPDANEDLMFEEVRELCTLCAKGIVKISDDTHIHPKLVAKLFVETFQQILKMMDEK